MQRDGWIYYAGQWLREIAGGGGDPDISFPEQSPEEKQLQAEQVQLLRDQRDILSRQMREQQLLSPILFKAAGIEPIYNDFSKQLTDLNAQRKAAYEKAGNNSSDPAVRALDTQINALKARGNEISGYREIEDPNASLRKELETRYMTRTLAALRGELPDNPALLRDLRENEATLRESLRKQLGPGYATSTPGQQALNMFGESRQGILEGARRGDLSLAESLGLSRDQANQQRTAQFLQQLSGINQQPLGTAAAFGQNAAGYNPILARLLQAREGQFGANAIQFQYDADDPFTGRNLFRSFQTDARTFGGAAMGAGMSTARVKKDIEPLDKDGASALKKLRETPMFKWRYLWEDDTLPKRTGPILEAAPDEIKEPDGWHVNQIGYSALLHAGVKELDKEVRTLRQMMGRK